MTTVCNVYSCRGYVRDEQLAKTIRLLLKKISVKVSNSNLFRLIIQFSPKCKLKFYAFPSKVQLRSLEMDQKCLNPKLMTLLLIQPE